MLDLLHFKVDEEVDAKKCFKFGILLLNDTTPTSSKVCGILKAHQKDEDSVREFLKVWIRGEGLLPVTWKTLVETLRKCEIMDLADNIEDKKIGMIISHETTPHSPKV